MSYTETEEFVVDTDSKPRGETKAPVNLFNPDESELAPKPLPAFVEGARAETAPVPVQRELWQFLVLLALVLLIIEGALYWRRQTAGRYGLPFNDGDRWALRLRRVLPLLLATALVRPMLPRGV